MIRLLAIASFVPFAAQAQEFEVASIKLAGPEQAGRSSFNTSAGSMRIIASLKAMIAKAYEVAEFQVQAGPSWLNDDRYVVEARIADGSAAPSGTTYEDHRRRELEMHQRLEALLASRFQVKIRRETRELPVYSLVVDKKGIKFKEGQKESGLSTNRNRAAGTMVGTGARMDALAQVLGNMVERPVNDSTGLRGIYDFTMTWMPEQFGGDPGAPQVEVSGPSLFTALQEQLGLKLESGKGPVEVLVVERAERPSDN
jgi:uncharacterized protein (TIGR03435 family)